MTKTILSYLKFIWNSKNEHGVHSPFVFDLVTKCFYDKKKYPEYEVLKSYRKSLLNNHTTIEVTDFGAGSRVFTSNQRKVSAIAKNAGICPKNAELLFRMVRYFQPESILEIGTSLGLATAALYLENQSRSQATKIITLEGCPNTLNQCKSQFQSHFQNSNCNIEFINTEFSSYLETATENCDWKLILFDGNHSKKATLEYFELLLPTVSNDSVWIFDDIHWSKDMEEAWELIKNHPKVTVTLDTFQWGIVFFRSEQAKEHFTIRI
jgi:predicted O-methyltransferase YrrM